MGKVRAQLTRQNHKQGSRLPHIHSSSTPLPSPRRTNEPGLWRGVCVCEGPRRRACRVGRTKGGSSRSRQAGHDRSAPRRRRPIPVPHNQPVVGLICGNGGACMCELDAGVERVAGVCVCMMPHMRSSRRGGASLFRIARSSDAENARQGGPRRWKKGVGASLEDEGGGRGCGRPRRVRARASELLVEPTKRVGSSSCVSSLALSALLMSSVERADDEQH